MPQFYRKLNPQTGVEDLYEAGTNRYIGPTEFGKGEGFKEQTQPNIMRDGAGYQVKAPGSGLLESFKGQTNFTEDVKELIRRKQKIQEPLTEQKAYWRTLQRDVAPFGGARPPEEGAMPGVFKDAALRELSPAEQASIRSARYTAAGAHLQGIREEEEYRGTRIEDIVGSITDMMEEKDKLAKSELDKTYKQLQIAKARKDLGLEPTAEDLGLDPDKGIGTKVGGSVSWRHNNPGNIKFGNFAKKYGAKEGQKATDGGSFAVFPDTETGYKAMKELLQAPSYSKLNLEQAMRRWSGNGYGADVWAQGISKPTDMMTDEEINSLMQAMVNREGWKEGTILETAEELGLALTEAKKTGLMQKAGLSNADIAGYTEDDWIMLQDITRESLIDEAAEQLEEWKKETKDGGILKGKLQQKYGSKLSQSDQESVMRLGGGKKIGDLFGGQWQF